MRRHRRRRSTRVLRRLGALGAVVAILVGGAIALAHYAGGARRSGGRAIQSGAAARPHGHQGAAIPAEDGLPAVQYSPNHLPPVWPGAVGKALPYPIIIADRGNNRVLEVTPAKQIVWEFPNAKTPQGTQFAYDDDTFFTPSGNSIITNEEDRAQLAVINYYRQAITWTYGHFGVKGYYGGNLNYPDDAYRLPNGTTITADIRNCRELFISPQGTILQQWGVNQKPWLHFCTTAIGATAQQSKFGYPNGDTPQPNGDILMSVIGGNWIVLFSPSGRTIWKIQAPIPNNGCQYVSDAQLLTDGNVLVADYAGPTQNAKYCPPVPGQVIILNPHTGQVVWRYAVASGPGELNHPSLAEMLPNGNIVLNDDYNDRVVVIDPHTNRIVWQYGVTATPGTAPGYLNTPDGLAVDYYRNWSGWLGQHPGNVLAQAPQTSASGSAASVTPGS